ncbi:MAG: hypothetical protein AAFV98_24985, partial [Chloroflexota bacterium]
MPIIQVLIFRGTGGVYNTEHPFHDEPALVRAGHVGLLGVVEDTIIGFHPTPEASNTVGGEKALLSALRENKAQAGRLQNDNRYFERAHDLIGKTEGRTTVYRYEVEISDDTLVKMRSWYNDKEERLYSFPNTDGSFSKDESHCATFWLMWF